MRLLTTILFIFLVLNLGAELIDRSVDRVMNKIDVEAFKEPRRAPSLAP